MPAGDRGFALVLVLWAVVLLTLVGVPMIRSGRTQYALASKLASAAALHAAADGAVQSTMFHLLAGTAYPSVTEAAGIKVLVVVDEEAGKINVNTAAAPLLHALLKTLGRPPELAERILDWRTAGRYARRDGAKAPEYRAAGRAFGPPGAGFRSLDELELVLGMTAEIARELRPALTIYSDVPILRLAGPLVSAVLSSPEVRAAIELPSVIPDATRAVCIRATASKDAELQAAVRSCMFLDRTATRPWQTVDWTENEEP